MNRQISKEALYILERFSDVQRGQVLTAWLEYSAHGVVPQIDDLAVDTALRAILSLEARAELVTSTTQQDMSSPHPVPAEQGQGEEPARNNLSKITTLKEKSLEIASYVKDDKKARRLRECSHRLVESSAGYISSQERCNSRICPVCRDIKSAKYRSTLHSAFDVLVDKSPNAKFLFVTFTVKNVQLKHINKAVDEVTTAWGKMTKRAVLVKNMYGFAKVVHIKKGTDNLANLHLHSIFAMKSGYRKLMNAADATDFQALWTQALDSKYTAIVDSKHILNNARLNDSIDYISDSGITEKEDLAWLAACDKALSQGRRFVAHGGFIKDILQDIRENKNSQWLEVFEPKIVYIWSEDQYKIEQRE